MRGKLANLAKMALGAAAWCAAGAVTAAEYSVNADACGITMKGDRLVLSEHGQVIAVTPDWRWRYYTIGNPHEDHNTPDGSSAKVVQTGRDEEVKLLDYSAKVTDDGIEVNVECTLVQDVPTNVETTVALVPIKLLAGANFTATLADGKTVSGVIPETYSATQVHYYFQNAMKAVFHTQFGVLTIETLEGKPFGMGDRRFNQFEGHHGFWFGGGVTMKMGEVVHNRYRVSFEPAATLVMPTVSGENKAAAPAVPAEDLVTAPALRKRAMLPAVKQATFSGEKYLPSGGEITIGFEDADEPARLERAVARVLGEQSGIAVDKLNLTIEKLPELDILKSPEQYFMTVTPDKGVIIASPTPRGAFYALQTLRNLYNPEDGSFDCARIMDYPDLEFRAAMFLVDDYSMVAHKYMIENLLAPLKINHIIMECEYAAWDNDKELHREHSISKQDLRDLIAVAKENYIDASPLFQTLGHCEWLFKDGRNLDLAEDPDYPYAYNVSNPRLYPYIDAMLDEVMEVFNDPKFLHIGHDEVLFYKNAKFPCREENLKKPVKDIIFDDIMHYYDYAKKHGSRVMMWHDMMVTHEECPEVGFGGEPHFIASRRPDLPRDIVFADWRYSGTYPEYPEIAKLTSEGFDVVGCSWYDRGNIENLSKGVKKGDGMGMLQTIWNGYFGNKQVLEDGFNQIAPYVRTACRTWDVRDEANTYDSHEVASRFYGKLTELAPAPGNMLDISGVANLEVSPANNPFLYLDTFGIDNALTPGVNRVGQVEFLIPGGEDGAIKAAALKSDLLPDAPAEVTLKTRLKAKRLFLLHTTTSTPARRLDPVATLEVKYLDNSTATAPVRYYADIAPVTEDYNKNLSVLNSLETDGGKVWYMTWENPHPEKTISRITLRGNAGCSYYLFGVSAEN